MNRRIHGLWSSTIPSRFIDELPATSVDVVEAPAHYSAGASRFDRNPQPFGSSYGTPGWQRAQERTQERSNAGSGGRGFGASPGGRGVSSGPRQIEGELIAKSTGTPSAFNEGQRVFHTKFGPGNVAAVDGNKLTVDFDKAGRKMVLESFVQPA